ncbi:hypothetical protein [Altericroceibacterium xinjiangense]|uniref:hypothetical protein n=1 Tax=Altericroceibacterium xinjiangense TaxID=762261 RepID=UPI0013E07C4F|nr:hypothetical protein [Altericroceibacterium xinjiangense]
MEPREMVEFEAASLSAALQLADRKIGDRAAEIWEDGNRLARIRKARSRNGIFWQIS